LNCSPSVTRLTIHDNGEQLVYFDSDEKAKGQVLSGKASQTTLTEFFELNKRGDCGAAGRSARSLLDNKIPNYYWWDAVLKVWKPRKSIDPAVGQIYSVSHLAGENFFLRVLLLHCKGAVSFDDLKIINGMKVKTYRKACIGLGLLIDDSLYHNTLQEVSLLKYGFQMTIFCLNMCSQTTFKPNKTLQQSLHGHNRQFEPGEYA
jgi:hypothetical protein